MSYYQDNKDLIEFLANESTVDTVHGTKMLVKNIPDPVDYTVLDPRVFDRRKEAAEKGNPLAEYIEIPVDLIRELPSYTGPGANDKEVSITEFSFKSRNGDTPCFKFTPEGGRKIKPVMLYFHGGAYIAGSTKAVTNFCKLIAELSDMIVISVEYRLAPEYKFPIGSYDCYDAVDYVYNHADELGIMRDVIAVGGDSAGSTFAIDCCLYERDAVNAGKLEKSRIKYQALIYPAVIVTAIKTDDYRFKMSEFNIPDDDELAMGAALSLKAMVGEMGYLYMDMEKVTDPIAVPLMQDSLSGLPKTMMAICEYDYLRLSGEAFARKLERDGVEHRAILYKGMDHSFIDETGRCPQAYDVAAEIAKDINELCEG